MSDPSPTTVRIPGLDVLRVVRRTEAWETLLARRRGSGELVAARVARHGSGPSSAAVAGWQRLGSHPHLERIVGVATTTTGRPVLLCEPARTVPLDTMPGHGGPDAWAWVLDVGVQLAGALAALHRAGRVHGAVTPDHVVVDDRNRAVLVEPRLGGDGEPGSLGALSASLAHAAPELADGAPVDAAAEQYALASVLLTCLLGRPPFVTDPGDAPAVVLRRTLVAPPPDLRGAGVPDDVVAVLHRGLAKRPEARYPDLVAFGVAFQGCQLAHDLPTSFLVTDFDPPEPGWTASASTARPVPRGALAVVAVAVALGAAVGASALVREGPGAGTAAPAAADGAATSPAPVTVNGPGATTAATSTGAGSTVATTSAPTTVSSAVPATTAVPTRITGYWVVYRDGRVASVGAAPPVRPLDTGGGLAPIVGAASAPGRTGVIAVRTDGAVVTSDGGPGPGSWTGKPAEVEIAGLAAAPTAVWITTRQGGARALVGAADVDAPPTGGVPIADGAAWPAGPGLWLVDEQGRVYASGPGIGYFGNWEGEPAPVARIAARPQGDGYWLVAADGRIQAKGAAPAFDRLPVVSPVVGAAASPTGNGLVVATADGSLYALGDAPYLGPVVPPAPTSPTPVTTASAPGAPAVVAVVPLVA